MTADRYILLILVAVGVLALFFQPSAGWALQGILRTDESSALLAQMNLARENTVLKTRIAESEALTRTAAILGSRDHVPAFVYSRYPFSFKNELLIAAGKESGLVASTGEGRRLVVQGGVRIDGERVSDPELRLRAAGTVLIQIGKRRLAKVVFPNAR